jgi:hypothetical protein
VRTREHRVPLLLHAGSPGEVEGQTECFTGSHDVCCNPHTSRLR